MSRWSIRIILSLSVFEKGSSGDGGVLQAAMAVACVSIAVLPHPIPKQHDERIAFGHFGFRMTGATFPFMFDATKLMTPLYFIVNAPSVPFELVPAVFLMTKGINSGVYGT